MTLDVGGLLGEGGRRHPRMLNCASGSARALRITALCASEARSLSPDSVCANDYRIAIDALADLGPVAREAPP